MGTLLKKPGKVAKCVMIDINSQKGIMAHLTVTQRTQLLAINVSGTNEPTYSQLGSLA